MNKKNNLKKAAALLLGIALAAGSTGCNFVVTDNEKDLGQTVAEVNISEGLRKDSNSEYAAVADDVAAIVENLSTDISKRDLVAYFLSVGYQYVESYGYTYEATFNMLMDGLVSREIMIQYAIAYYLKSNSEITVEDCNAYIEGELAKVTDETEKELLKAHPEVLTLKYFLTEGGEGSTEDYDRAVYSLKKSLNNSLDSLEESYIKAQSEEHDHGETRTLPTSVSKEKEDYYTDNYEIYTGRNTLDKCGEYEKVEGSTPSTRQNAYNAFLANLQSYNMISTSGKIEDTSDIKKINYYYVELSSTLGQSLINKYYEDLSESVTARQRAADVGRANTVHIVVRNEKMQDTTCQTKVLPTALCGDVAKTAYELFCKHFPHGTRVRMLGVTLSGFDYHVEQMSLLDGVMENGTSYEKRERAEDAIAKIREKYGYATVQRGLVFEDEKLKGLDIRGKKEET